MQKNKKLALLLILLMLALLCLLAGCNDREIGYDVKFLHFVDGNGQTVFDFQLDQYYKSDKLKQKLNEVNIPFYTKNGAKYLDGTEFSVDKDKINEYFVAHDADCTVYAKVSLSKKDYPAYTVVLNLVPVDYTVTYLDIEGATFDGATTYNVESDSALSKPSKPFYRFAYWYEIGENDTQNVVNALPTNEPHNITLYAKWEPKKINLVYQGLYGTIANPNEVEAVYQRDGAYTLLPVQSTAAYEFKGWKLNGNYITEIDPVELWNTSSDSSEMQLTLTADIEFKQFEVKYYVGGELNDTKTFDYFTLQEFENPAVPSIDHYVGRWSEEVTEFKNYIITAIYEVERFEVAVCTNVSGYSIETQNYVYGTKYKTVYDKLSYENKVLVGLYYDEDCLNKVNKDDLIDKSGTLYAKWYDRYVISSAADWVLLSTHPSAYFVIENDINFLGEAIPIVAEFNGVLDGQGHTVSNFNNQNSSCDIIYGLFSKNNGTISNINYINGSYNVVSPEGAYDTGIGFLCGINKGTISNVQLSNVTVNITNRHSTKWLDELSASSSEVNLHSGVLAAINLGTISQIELDETVLAEINTFMYSSIGNDSIDTFRTWGHYGLLVGTNKGQINSVTALGSLYSTATQMDEIDKQIYTGNNYFPLQAGGIVGNNAKEGTVSDALCNATVRINLESDKRKFFGIVDLGGICAFNNGQLNKCRVSESALLDISFIPGIRLSGTSEIRMGGVCGNNEGDSAIIKASYSEARFKIVSTNNLYVVDKFIGGIAGLNTARVAYSYAIVRSVEASINNRRQGNESFGGLFGYDKYNSSTGLTTHCFAVLDVDLSSLSTMFKSYQGKAEGTVINSFVYATDTAAGFNDDEYVATLCATEQELFAALDKTEYEAMGFSFADNYPTLPNVGKQLENRRI